MISMSSWDDFSFFLTQAIIFGSICMLTWLVGCEYFRLFFCFKNEIVHHILMTGTAWHQKGLWGGRSEECQESITKPEPAGLQENNQFHLPSPAFTCTPFDNFLLFRAEWVGAVDLVPRDLTRFSLEYEIWPGGVGGEWGMLPAQIRVQAVLSAG